MNHYDLIVIGGGIGGSAMATTMARAGRSVLVLERSKVFEDQVRGEWIAPWGVSEAKRLGLLALLRGAGGHFVKRHVTYDETISQAQAEASAMPLDIFASEVPGPMTIGHPHHCQTLYDEAVIAGAHMLRGVVVLETKVGAKPSVTYTDADGEQHQASARLLIGADGRNSKTRPAWGIAQHADKPHHLFGGMLVEDAGGWRPDKQAIGTEGSFGFFVFPQGKGKVRLYGSYSLNDAKRFAGPGGDRRFLDTFAMACSPENRHLVAGRPAGPLRSFLNNDIWTDEPFTTGGVLIGDAAGHNDPILGQGLSNAYRDVRIVSDLLLGSVDWLPALFAPYATERFERMRRLRFVASLVSELDAEFGEEARQRRHDYHMRSVMDPSLRAHVIATMTGPEKASPEVFAPAYRARVLGLKAMA